MKAIIMRYFALLLISLGFAGPASAFGCKLTPTGFVCPDPPGRGTGGTTSSETDPKDKALMLQQLLSDPDIKTILEDIQK